MKRVNSVLLAFSFVILAASFAAGQNEISGGILNGKAVNLPKPVYSEEAKAAGLKGTVRVSVLVDELGSVISAEVIGGFGKITRSSDGKTENIEIEPVDPLLADAARQAALAAKFAPTTINGVPVRVKGTIVYNFVPTEGSIATAGSTSVNGGGGLLNGKATSLPAPAYPPAALAVRASGAVSVQVTIDEEGNVIAASAVSGHPLLRSAAVTAARGAKFSPTFLNGEAVKVTGVVVYNFIPPKTQNKQDDQ